MTLTWTCMMESRSLKRVEHSNSVVMFSIYPIVSQTEWQLEKWLAQMMG